MIPTTGEHAAAAATRALGVEALEAVGLVGSLGQWVAPRCWRVRLADGRTVKARPLRTAPEAARLEDLSRCLSSDHFPAVLARRGRWVLTGWAEGRPPGPEDLTAALLRRCGGLLAGVHRVRPPGLEPFRAAPFGSRAAALPDRLARLARRGLVEPGRAERLARAALAARPERAELTLIHGDFSADNLVLDAAGVPWVVDNRTLTTGHPEYDLARTWYRWPMTPAQRRAFAAGYEEHRSTAAFRAGFAFWATLAVLSGIEYRLGAAGSLRAALRRLRALDRLVGRSVAVVEGEWLTAPARTAVR